VFLSGRRSVGEVIEEDIVLVVSLVRSPAGVRVIPGNGPSLNTRRGGTTG
jgi:predicted Kef-type K+ transport protein